MTNVSAARRLYRQVRRYARGPRTAWAIDTLRPRILRTPPVHTPSPIDTRVEAHVLTSQNDWLNLTWCLKSFYAVAGGSGDAVPVALCIHDDGSLKADAIHALCSHFPGARLVHRGEADEVVPATLAGLPKCISFRSENQLAQKVFDFRHYLARTCDRMLLLDSDVLFFSRPDELLERLSLPGYRKNSVNSDIASAYTISPEDALRLSGVALVERFNSGLGLIHRDSIRIEWIEEFLNLPDILSHSWRIEQTLYALCSSRFGHEPLPADYDVFLNGSVGHRPVRHYVGAIRHLMYTEGMRKLVRGKLLRTTRKIPSVAA